LQDTFWTDDYVNSIYVICTMKDIL